MLEGVIPSDEEVGIRRAIPADADEILHVLHATFESYRSNYTHEAFHDTVLTAETVGPRMQSMHVFVAVSGTDIVGTIACARVDPQEGHLRGMAVLPTHQGSGLAARLLKAAEDDLAEQGCSRITLDTTLPLQRAIRFYETNGYRRSGKIGEFFGMPLYEYVKDLR
jgi:ribosomal protein S18 acetylase RimI-like enzyme